jgi:predicted transcriptional regulator
MLGGLAPLERECMQTLWPLGQGTVRQIRDELARTRPRAYTTIMTIMNRLAQKGVVARSKVGRAYLYRPSLTAEQARAHAVDQLVAHFFGGSTEALLEHLGEEGAQAPTESGMSRASAAPEHPAARHTKPRAKEEAVPAAAIDESLL